MVHKTGYITYVASKIVTEKAVWKFVEEEKPDFELNVVCPFTNIGKVLDKAQAPELRTLVSGFVGAGEQVKAMLAIFSEYQILTLYSGIHQHSRRCYHPRWSCLGSRRQE